MLFSELCNKCVNNISQFQFSCILKLYGIKNVQIAPTKIIDSWKQLNSIDFEVFTKNDINVYSFQSITYTLNHLNIFDEKTQDELFIH